MAGWVAARALSEGKGARKHRLVATPAEDSELIPGKLIPHFAIGVFGMTHRPPRSRHDVDLQRAFA